MWKERVQLAASLSVGTLAIVGLHRISSRVPIDWTDPIGWLGRTPIEDAVTEAVRLVGLGLSYWFVISTLLYLLAVLSRVPTAIRAVEWATLPAVRRITSRIAAVTLATSMAAPAAVLLAPPAPDPPTGQATITNEQAGELTVPFAGDRLVPTVQVTDEGVVVPPGYQEPAPPGYEPTVGTPESPTTPAPADGSAETEVVARQDSHVVVDGDHLWSIASSHLASSLGRAPSDAEIVPYWMRVIQTNLSNLTSGDADLIYPGEVIELPPVEGNHS